MFEQRIEIRPLNLKKLVSKRSLQACPTLQSWPSREICEGVGSTSIPTIWNGRVREPILACMCTSLKRVGRNPRVGQVFRLRFTMPRASLPKKLDIGMYSLCRNATSHDETNRSHSKGLTPPITPHNKKKLIYLLNKYFIILMKNKSNPIMCITPTRRSVRRQSSEELQPYATPPTTAQPRFNQAKENTSGVASAKPRTAHAGVSSSSNPLGMNLYISKPAQYPLIKTQDRQNNIQTPAIPNTQLEILHSTFHRFSFESMSPLAMKFDQYNSNSKRAKHTATSVIPLKSRCRTSTYPHPRQSQNSLSAPGLNWPTKRRNGS